MTTTSAATPTTSPAPRPAAGVTAAAPASPAASVQRGSSIPARWRITGWILLTTMMALIAVTVTARSIFLTQVEQDANAEIAQEFDEFARFATEGVDPTTTRPFGSAERLLATYLARQSPGTGESMAGVIGTQVVGTQTPDRGSTPDLADADDLLEDMLDPRQRSGSLPETEDGPVRWGRAEFVVGSETGALVIAQFTDQERDGVDDAVVTIAWVALGGLLLSSVIAWLVAGQILAPIRQVHQVAKDITEHDLTGRVPVSGRDDISAVAETFNAMLDRLERASTTQQKFVDDASHELRTPITVVRGHLELLESEPERRAETLRLVDTELARMGRIVSDLLMLARAEQPNFVKVQEVDATSLTLDVETKAQALGDRRWRLMEIAEGTIRVDEQRVTQAVLQLAANAVQYTATGSTVRLGSRFEGRAADRVVVFWVADDGPGVEEHEASRIFERFHHGSANDAPPQHGSGSGQRDGAGLGLAIVRAIADAHRGSAWLTSTPGHGATFGITVPAPTAARDAGDEPAPAPEDGAAP
ncbi:two-component system OmpR family sensor kinase [Clavibacter sp. B3I6]|nr:two-component system OmpR family sensor kinase [Clavibacter sp. B3I6]